MLGETKCVEIGFDFIVFNICYKISSVRVFIDYKSLAIDWEKNQLCDSI